jgi:hypothetical protein
MNEKPFKDNFVARLIRERDEARAELKYQTDRAEYISAEGRELRQVLERERNEAEQRGFERGVREAAKAAEDAPVPSRIIVRAILALLEPVTPQKPEA